MTLARPGGDGPPPAPPAVCTAVVTDTPLVLHFLPLVPASTPCQRGIICRLGSILRRQHKNFAEATQDQPMPAHPGTNSPGQTLRQLRGDPTACSHRHFLRSATQGTEHQTVASAIACGLPLLIPGRLRPPALLVTLKVARYACRGDCQLNGSVPLSVVTACQVMPQFVSCGMVGRV
jgi:hypothetical protein